MVKVQAVPRVFRFNGVDLGDPAPDKSPQEVIRLLSVQYPDISTAQMESPVVEGGRMVIECRRALGAKG